MNTAVLSRWGRPLIAAALIAAAFAVPAAGASRPASIAGNILMVLAAIVAGLPIATAAFNALRRRSISIDLLVSVAAIGAIIVGNYWEAAAVTFLFTVGHVLELQTMQKTRGALATLVDCAPQEAIVLIDDQQVSVAAEDVVVGQQVIVKTGMKVPVDGVVVSGVGGVDESSVTGESIPAEKATGDRVHAGTILTAGLLTVEAEHVGADTTLARIIHRVEQAQDAKAATQTFMEKFSRWYTPGIVLLSLVSGLVSRDLELALTLLVIGCPGALVISIPVAIVAGIGRGARDGVLIKGGEYLESSAKINAVALDKTGTLTNGRPQLSGIVALNGDETEVLRVAASLEAGSGHPLAAPIVAGARQRGMVLSELPDDVETVLGRGVVGTVDGHRVAVGNLALARQEGVDDLTRAEAEVNRLAQAGSTPMLVTSDHEVLGVIAVADQIRPEAAQMVADLHRLGVKHVVMLTGDAEPVARAVGAQVGVDEVRAGLLPEDKLAAIVGLQQRGYTVAMVGDGVNDAPALATANIGVAMGAAGSATAVETADIALMGDRLELLPHALGLARGTVSVMHQNITLAVGVVALLLAGVFAGGVTMAVGMLVHEASVLVVIANAMRLLGRKARRADSPKPAKQVAAAQLTSVGA